MLKSTVVTHGTIISSNLGHYRLNCHALRRLSLILNKQLLNIIHLYVKQNQRWYKTAIQPCVDYACSVWGNCFDKNRNLILNLQRRSARIVTKQFHYFASSTKLFRVLLWQPLEKRRELIFLPIVRAHLERGF